MIILPLDVGGQPYGDVLLTKDYVLEGEITYGKCKSKDLKQIGTVKVKEDKIEVIPHVHCLPERKLFHRERPQVKETPFSFFVNYYYELGGKEPVYNFQGGLYLKGLFTTAYKDKESIKNYRLSYDFLEKDLNLTAGYTFSRGFSVINGYYGRGIVLNRKVIFGEPLTGKSHQLVLTTQSEVEVYRNGILIQKLSLPAGVYNVESLPVSGLTNELTIRIRDSLGRVREEKLFLLHSPDVLRKGKTDFSVGLFEKRQTGLLRHGYSDHLTLNLAGNNKEQGLGFDVLTKYGVFSPFASTKNYELRYYTELKDWSLGLALREKDVRYQLGGRYKDISIQVYGHKNEHSFLGINLSTRPFKNSHLNLSYSRSSINKQTFSITFTYLWGYHSFTSTVSKTNANNNTASFTAQKNPLTHKAIDYGYRINYQENQQQDFYSASLTLKSINLTELRVSQSFGERKQVVSFAGSVGCAYDDGLDCGVGLPIYDAFVIGRNLKSIYGNTFSLLPVPSYQNLKITSEAGMRQASFEGALRHGQGIAIKQGYDAMITIYLDGEPLRAQVVKINGEDYVTTSQGQVFLENVRGEVLIEYKGIQKRIRVKDGDSVFLQSGGQR